MPCMNLHDETTKAVSVGSFSSRQQTTGRQVMLAETLFSGGVDHLKRLPADPRTGESNQYTGTVLFKQNGRGEQN